MPTQTPAARSPLRAVAWKELRGLVLPAALFGGLWLLLGVAFPWAVAEPRQRAATAVQAGLALGGAFAVLAGLLATAGEAESGTDRWLRSLPANPRRLAAGKFAAAGLAAFAGTLLLSLPASFFVTSPAYLDVATPTQLRPAAVVPTAAAVAAAGLAAGLWGGSLGGRLPTGGLAAAGLIVAAAVAGTTSASVVGGGSRWAAWAAVLAAFTAAGAAAAVRRFGRTQRAGRGASWPSAAGGLRRLVEGRVHSRQARETAALAWREAPTAIWFAIGLGGTMYAATVAPLRIFVVFTAAPLAGVLSAATDAESGTRPFLRGRGVGGTRLWLVKSGVWLTAVSTALVCALGVEAATLGTWSVPPGWSPRGDTRVPAPTPAAFATLFPEVSHSGYPPMGHVPLRTRPHVLATAAVGIAALFFGAQAAAVWFRSRLVGAVLGVPVGLLAGQVLGGLAVLRTPWPPLLFGLAVVVAFAWRGFTDVMRRRSSTGRRLVVGFVSAAVFLWGVRAARLKMVPVVEDITGESYAETDPVDRTRPAVDLSGTPLVPPGAADAGRLLDALSTEETALPADEETFEKAVAGYLASVPDHGLVLAYLRPPLASRSRSAEAAAVTLAWDARRKWAAGEDAAGFARWKAAAYYVEVAAVYGRSRSELQEAVELRGVLLQELRTRMRSGRPFTTPELETLSEMLAASSPDEAPRATITLLDNLRREAPPGSVSPGRPDAVTRAVDWVLASEEVADRAERLSLWAVPVPTGMDAVEWDQLGFSAAEAYFWLLVAPSRSEDLRQTTAAAVGGGSPWYFTEAAWFWERHHAEVEDAVFDELERRFEAAGG